MTDAIDRLKAIDAIDGALLDEVIEGIVINILLDLPSVQPDRKTSEWLHEYLQTAVDFGIITETQASRLMDMIAEDNT